MTDSHGRVGTTLASLSESPGFKALPSLRFLMVSFSPSMQIPVGWKCLYNEELHNLVCS